MLTPNLEGQENEHTPTETPTPESGAGQTPEVPNPETPAPEAGSEGEVDPALAAANTPPAYTPNLKFKVMDKEHEFAPFLKDVIKDEKTEKEVRELYEKAFGLDVVKPKYQTLKTQHDKLAQDHQGLVGGLQDLRADFQRGDLDSFFDKLKIPFNTLLQYVAEKVQYSELPPDQQRAIDSRKQSERQAYEAQKQLQDQGQQFQEQAVQAKGYMLDLTLDRADVKAFANQFQERFGKSFRDVVIEYGEAAYYTRKVDLTPQQVVEELMGFYGKAFAPPAAAAAPAQAPQPGATAAPAAPAQKPPVIPNVSGRQTSPTGSKPKSLDELRKLAKSMSTET